MIGPAVTLLWGALWAAQPAPPAPAGEQLPYELSSRPLRGLRAEAATLLVQGREGSNLPAIARIGPAVSGGDRPLLPLRIEIAGHALVEADADTLLALEIHAYVLDASERVVGHFSELLELDLSQLGERLWSSGIRYVGAVELPSQPGVYSARSLVFAPEQQRFSLQVQEVEVTDSPPSPTLFPEVISSAGWIQARASEATFEAASLRPVLVPGTVEISLPEAARRLAGRELEVVLSRRLREPDTTVTPVAPIAARQSESAEAPGTRLQFDLPPLPRGVYDLSLRVGGEAPPPDDFESVEAWIVEESDLPAIYAGGDPRALQWPDLLRWEATRAPQLADADVEVASRQASKRQFQRRYRALLDELGRSRDLENGVARLAAIEEQTVDDSLDHRLLGAAQLEVAVQLISGQEEALIGLLALHEASYRHRRESHDFAAAGHHRELCLAITARAAQLPESILVVASQHLTRLALVVDRYGMWPETRRILERAVALDPANVAAHLLLSEVLERQGAYPQALEIAEHLLALDAEQELAKLRRAVLLRRLGKDDHSRHALERLIREQSSHFVRVLAYQELVSLLAETGAIDEALRVLREGLSRWPQNPGLLLLLARNLDRLGRSLEASGAISRLAASDVGGGPSPRFLYTQMPEGLEERLQQATATTGQLYLPFLAEAEP